MMNHEPDDKTSKNEEIKRQYSAAVNYIKHKYGDDPPSYGLMQPISSTFSKYKGDKLPIGEPDPRSFNSSNCVPPLGGYPSYGYPKSRTVNEKRTVREFAADGKTVVKETITETTTVHHDNYSPYYWNTTTSPTWTASNT